MKNEATMVNSQKIQIVNYCFALQCMTQQYIWFDLIKWRGATYIDIDMGNFNNKFLHSQRFHDAVGQSASLVSEG